jgi:hypothetical protein
VNELAAINPKGIRGGAWIGCDLSRSKCLTEAAESGSVEVDEVIEALLFGPCQKLLFEENSSL